MYWINVYDGCEPTKHDTFDDALDDYKDFLDTCWIEKRALFVECLYRGVYRGRVGTWPITESEMDDALEFRKQNIEADNRQERSLEGVGR